MQQVTLLLVTTVTTMIGIYALNTLILTFISLYGRNKVEKPPQIADWPTVSIHLPLYNEKKVASRLINSCLSLNYPKDKVEIIVVDDSNDGTTEIVQALERSNPKLVKVIHRESRDGYKAKALQVALENSRGEFIAIFDADFVPPSDFLRRLVPYFQISDKIAFVQARYGHLNSGSSRLTKGIALGIDGYCMVEQRARYVANLLAHFSGTSGIFRRKAVESAGGWSADTLVEDLDLSVRLQMGGWKYIYVPSVVCPGEIPPMFDAFKKQQHRWVKGHTECLRKHWKSILKHDGWSPLKKFQALIQLSIYFVFPLTIAAFFLTVLSYVVFPLFFFLHEYWRYEFTPLILGFSAIIYAAPLTSYGMTIVELRHENREGLKRLIYILYLMYLGYRLVLSNTRAIFEALLGRKSPFYRTPKFGLIDKV